MRVTAPSSGRVVTLHEPTGEDDLLLMDYRFDGPRLVREFMDRVAEAEEDIDWGALPVVDIDALVMRIRQLVLGDRVHTVIPCALGDCGKRVDISFSVEAYLNFHRPHLGPITRRGWRVSEPDSEGWRTISGLKIGEGRFRLPTLNDQIAVFSQADAPAALALRCIQAETSGTQLSSLIETALALCAPPLAGALDGRCPDCGTEIAARFEARAYCLQELRFRAPYIYDDIDVLARRYHWSERAILRMPYARRTQYVERALRGEAA